MSSSRNLVASLLALMLLSSWQPAAAKEGGAAADPLRTYGPGDPYDHNGSGVMFYPERGLIVYWRPKASLAGTVRPGDVLFRGRFDEKTGAMVGTAYVFKPGCPPLPYAVSGGPYRAGGDAPVLRGLAPVRAGGSCAATGYSATGGNATLRFTWEGGDI